MLTPSDQKFLDGLRKALEREYQSQRRAISQLESYLKGEPLEGHLQREAAFTLLKAAQNLRGQGTIRERVFQAITGDWKSVSQIAEETELSKTQIRGVLYAADIVGSRVQSTPQFGEMQFRVIPTNE